MSRERTYDPTEGEFVDFETLADWEQRDKAKDARIAAEVEAKTVSLAHPLVLKRIMQNPVPKGTMK